MKESFLSVPNHKLYTACRELFFLSMYDLLRLVARSEE